MPFLRSTPTAEELKAKHPELRTPGREPPPGSRRVRPHWPFAVAIAAALALFGLWGLIQPQTTDELLHSDHDSLVEMHLRERAVETQAEVGIQYDSWIQARIREEARKQGL